MSKAIKDLITDDLRSRYAGVSDACVVDVTRLDVPSVTKLRADLRARQIEIRVVKNSMARRAFADSTLKPLGDALSGSCALVTGGDSIIEVAKALAEARKEFELLELKEAMLEGDASLVSVEMLSKMKGRLELLADLAGLLASPGRALSGCLQGAGGRIAGCLKTLADKADAEGSAESDAGTDAAEAPAAAN